MGIDFRHIAVRYCKHVRAAHADLLYIARGLGGKALLRDERHNEGAFLDQGYRAVLQFSRGVGFGMDVAYLLELERRLHGEGGIYAAPNEEHVLFGKYAARVILYLAAAVNEPLHAVGDQGKL